MSQQLTRALALAARGITEYELNPPLKTQVRHANPGQSCHHWLYHRITCDEYDDLRSRAAGHCELCGTPEGETGGGRLVVDHYGGFGSRGVRGMLCDYCNNVVMSCMDGYKNWSETSWAYRDRALAYVARSWRRFDEEDWLRIVDEVGKRMRGRAYSPRVPSGHLARYRQVWPVMFVVALRTVEAEEDLETESRNSLA